MMEVKPRRFEMGASGTGMDDYLQERGYSVKMIHGRGYNVIGPKGGAPRKLRLCELIDLIDNVRMSEGLEPIKRR